MANTVSIDALRPEIWQKVLMKNLKDMNFFSRFMGDGENNIVQTKTDLKKQSGDTITIPLTAKLSGNGVTGDSELEGQEEAISAYSDSVAIDQIRNAVRLTGKLDEKKNCYNMRKDATNKLAIWASEFVERQMFMKLAGVNNTTLTDVAGNVVGTRCAWSNPPTQVPTADTAVGHGDRYLCADYTSGADSLASTDLLTPELISRAKYKAMQKQASGMPKINPLRIDGREHYVMFIHPWQAFDLKNNATFAQAQREAGTRGNTNRIFTGALGVWDGVILYEHEYVPFLDISVAGHNFNAAAAGTDITADCFRALLCGQQAAVFAQTQDSFMMVEETFDYKNKVGYATGLIGGIQKLTFNSKDYGVVAVDTAATALV
jgi:N4-gp56 family major capsid protein